ncbi:hypothetical protein PHLCEN_2v8054 [Hermanssonia centrifuga]|uniref:YDG domain-containing protein n=1 Tax=Hermanssonia centrifuga TaxID=98765 RepID=A0A2R6NUV0_9APHY|nr:hypothetical protein PHLCEN_2v8054 [Hermanssonia centrifuga]
MNEPDTHMMDFRLRNPIEFGRLPGLKAYDSWDSQQECCDFRVHGHRENRMVGDREGVRSIIMSGAYEDDEDQGNVV